MGDYGTKDLKELLDFVLTTGEEAHEAAKNGIGLDDTSRLFTIAKTVPAAFEGVGNIPNEIMDLDDAEYKDICDYVEKEFDIDKDDVEEVVELAFTQVVGMVLLYTKIKAIRAKKEVSE